MNKENIKKLKSFVDYKMKKNESEEYYMKKEYFNEFVVNEHDKGHRPVEYIEKDYFEELNLDVSMNFFKWYLLNYCEPCETYIAYDKNPLDFYDILKCSQELKNQDIKKLKKQYKEYNNQDNVKDDTYYFAEIEYYKKPTDKNHVIKFNDYAIVFNGWAYLDPNGKYKRVQIPVNPKGYDNKVLKKFYRRPSEMKQEIAESILNKLLKTHKDLQLEKPNNK